MGETQQSTCSFLLKLVLIIPLCYFNQLIVAETTGNQTEGRIQHGDESFNLKDRMSQAEVKIKQQGEEIYVLKTTVHESKEVINKLSNRLAHFEASAAINNGKRNKDSISRQKRPFRLAPV